MKSVQFEDLEFQTVWSEDDPAICTRLTYVTHWQAGARSSAAVYFELEPGKRIGRHRHSAEETIVVIEGEVEVTVGDECRPLAGGSLALAPALVRHDLRCTGDTTARCIGFWSSSSVVSMWDRVLQPRNSRWAGTPIPADADSNHHHGVSREGSDALS